MKHLSQIYADELAPASLPFVATEPERCEIIEEPMPCSEHSQFENKMGYLGNEVSVF